MIELRGEKIVLRPLEREHCRQLWRDYEPGEALPVETADPAASAEGADKWFEEIQAKHAKEQYYFGVFLPDGELIGDIQIAHIDWRHRTATLGYGVSRRAQRRRGYGTDAVRTAIRFAFGFLDLCRVSASCAEYNAASRRVLEKCGFSLEGRARQAEYGGGRRYDQLHFGLLRLEYDATSKAPPS